MRMKFLRVRFAHPEMKDAGLVMINPDDSVDMGTRHDYLDKL
jgi:hypothetical protein